MVLYNQVLKDLVVNQPLVRKYIIHILFYNYIQILR
jgi:hypothetical protein